MEDKLIKNIDYAPICLFVYNRPMHTKRTVEALKNNFLANKSELFIFSDGGKNVETFEKVKSVRNYIRSVEGFKSVQVFESEDNKGLANSIIQGVSKIIKKHGKVIVLEDDLITSPNFLNFMNQSLDVYEKNDKIFSVTGWSLDLKALNNLKVDYYYHYRMSSWGWGTWEDRWSKINWEDYYYESFKTNLRKQFQFRRGGADMPKMLKKYLKGKNNSWAIRACYYQFENDLLTVAPVISKVNNIGFGSDATHTKKNNRYDQVLDKGIKIFFYFNNEIKMDKTILKEFKNTFSLVNRIKSKLNF